MKRTVAYFLIFAVLGLNSSLGQVEVFTGHRRVNPPHRMAGVYQSCYSAPAVASCTMAADAAAGDVLIWYSFDNSFSAVPQSPSITLGRCAGGWHVLQSGIQEFFMATETDYCQVTSTGPATITGGIEGSSFVVIEATGVAAASPIDASASITFTSFSTTVSNTITTTVANDLILSFESYEYGTTSMAASAGWTWVTGAGLGLTTFRPMNGFSQLATAAGAYPVTFTNADSPQARGFSSTMVAIKPL